MKLARWSLGIVFSLSLNVGHSRADDLVGRAQQWLLASEQVDGTFAGLPIVDAVEAVQALPEGRARDTARFALAMARADNKEAALARAFALIGTAYQDPWELDPLRVALLEDEAGLAFGAAGTDPLVLAWGCRIAALESDDALLDRLAAGLARLQRPDGGFGFADNASDPGLTAEIALQLEGASGSPAAASVRVGAQRWLRTNVAPGTAPDAELAAAVLALRAFDPALASALVQELAARQSPSGAFGAGDVRATALSARALVRALPDLVLAGTLAGPDDAVLGQAFALRVNVSNSGPTGSGPTRLDVVVRDEAGAVVVTRNVEVQAVPALGSVSLVVDLGTQSARGWRMAQLLLNADQSVAEGRWDNDVATLRYRVADPPDLEVLPGDVAFTPDPPALFQRNTVTVRVRNVGEAVARDVYVQVFAGDPGAGGRLLSDAWLNAVAVGVPRTVTVAYEPKTLDPSAIVVRVDPANTVIESNERNNIASRPVQPVAPADMQTDLVPSITLAATTVHGSPFAITWTATSYVTRFGHPYLATEFYPYPRFQAVLYRGVPGAGGVELDRQWFTGWGATGVTTRIETSALPDGDYTYSVVVDPDNLVPETNEGDNVASATTTLQTGDRADLWFERLSVTPAEVSPGEAFTVEAVIRNSGKAAASNVAVQLSGGAFPPTGARGVIAQIAPGETGTVRIDGRTPSDAPGEASINGVVNPGWVIPEDVITNNTAQATLLVRAPRLAIDSLTVIPSPIVATQPAVLRAVVRNSGTGVGPYVTVGVTNHGATSGTYPPAGATVTLDVPLNTAGLVGALDATVIVGGGTNNLRQAFHVAVANPDFVVSAAQIGLAPEGAEPGATVTPTVVVENRGDIGGTASVHIYRGYPEQHDLASSGTVTVAAGGFATFVGPAFTSPTAPPYVVSVVVDEENAWPEPDEANNTATRPSLKRVGETIVAFEETHGQGNTVSTNPGDPTVGGSTGTYSEWAKDLEAGGYTVRTLSPDASGLTGAKLRGVDVLIDAEPMQPYSNADMRLLLDFVERGGGLLYLGEWGRASDPPAWAAIQDEISAALGLHDAHAFIGAPGFQCSGYWQYFARSQGGIVTHPTTTGLTMVQTQFVGGWDRLPPQAEPILRTAYPWEPASITSAVAFPRGSGRVIAIADTTMFESDEAVVASGLCAAQISMYARFPQNRRFGLQVVDWLANRSGGDYLPDLAFAPATIFVPPVMTAGDVVPVRVTVQNVGGALAPTHPTTVRLYQGTAASGRLIGEAVLDALTTGNSQGVEFPWDTTHEAGEQVLTAVVDPDDLVAELDEGNNTVSLPVVVRPAHDFRIDPSDIQLIAGTPAAVGITVHNVGYSDAPAGLVLRLTDELKTGQRRLPDVEVGPVPARGSVRVVVPWPSLDRRSAHRLRVFADPGMLFVDGYPEDNETWAEWAPPELLVAAPLPGTVWGGVKTIRWSASSAEGAVSTSVADGAPGGVATGLVPLTEATAATLDSTRLPDGPHRMRFVATDGVLETVQEVDYTVDNAARAVRTFGGNASEVSMAVGAATTRIRIPADSRVKSATALLDPSSASAVTASGVNYASPDLVHAFGKLWTFHMDQNRGGSLDFQFSGDGGLSWSAPASVSPAGMTVSWTAVGVNRYGLHAFFLDSSGMLHLASSSDGVTWSSVRDVGAARAGSITVNDEGMVFASGPSLSRVMVGDPTGTHWTPAATMIGFSNLPELTGVVSGGALHLFASNGVSLSYYRAPLSANILDIHSYSPPVVLGTGRPAQLQPLVKDGELFLAWVDSSNGWKTFLQRCDAAHRNCARDGWLPAPITLGTGSVVQIGARGPDVRAMVQYASWSLVSAGLQGGRRWTTLTDSTATGAGRALFTRDADLKIAPGPAYTVLVTRDPGFTPADLSLSVTGRPAFLARPDMGPPVQTHDFSDELNTWLAAHVDADDGAVDGFIDVPISAASRGWGTTVLRNLEIVYEPLAEVSAFALPPLFSPGASPGVLDTSTLSMRSGGEIAVMAPNGVALRRLVPSATGDRFVATFDGRNDAEDLIPSGLYAFGPAGWPQAEVEIDDLAPIAVLDDLGTGALGSGAEVRGIATDVDYAGTAKNFRSYLLEYSVDGTPWTRIAAADTPVSGVLGRWNVDAVSSASATLRLTVTDRAGNSTRVERGVRLQPGAPAAPVIDVPTATGSPLDVLASATPVGGTCEPGTTISLFVGGVAAGEAPCDGRWGVGAVVLPDAPVQIAASARRGTVEGPRSGSILVAKYGLGLALDVPSRALVGDPVAGTVHVQRSSVSAGPIQVLLELRDSAGRTVSGAVTPAVASVALPAVGAADLAFTVSTARLRPGPFTLVARTGAGALVPAVVNAPLAVEGTVRVAATLASDRAEYDAREQAALTAQILNEGLAPVGPLTATISVVTPDGQSAALGPFDVPALAPGEVRAVAALFGAPPMAVGTYGASLLVLDGFGAPVATATTSFRVGPANGGGTLAGTLQVTPAEYVAGDVLDARYTVTNGGVGALIPTSVLLVRVDTGEVIARDDRTPTIAAGATLSSAATLSTALGRGELMALLVGAGRGLAAQSIAAAPPRDTTPPVITIAGFQDGEYRSGAVTPVITITDESTYTATTTLSGQPFASGTPVTRDGSYTVDVSAVDAWSNRAAASRSFTIDTVPPTIQVTGVEQGELAGAPRTPTVQVDDLHLRSTRVMLDGSAFVPGTAIEADGDYTLDVTGDDLAGNTAQARVAFTIDRTPPLIQIAGVVDGELTNLTVLASVSISEPHPGTVTETLDGLPWDGLPITAEGSHRLEVQAVDAAGNASNAWVRFTIVKTPPRIEVSGVSDGALVNADVAPVVTIVSSLPTFWAAQLDGAPWAGATVAAEGDHLLSVAAHDTAGNEAVPVSVRFTIDRTPPRITLSGVSDGALTNQPVRPVISVEEAHPGTVNATLDGVAWTSGTTVGTEGDHLLQVTAVDGAQNRATGSVAFTLDLTPPEVTVVGVADGGSYAPGVSASWSVADAHPWTATATLDGAAYLPGTPIALVGTHVLAVHAVDQAGNARDVSLTFEVGLGELRATLHARASAATRILVALDCSKAPATTAALSISRPGVDPAACESARAPFLLATLRGAGYVVDVAHDASELASLLRSHRHGVRILYRAPLPEPTLLSELREATWTGGGVVSVSDAASEACPSAAPALRPSPGGEPSSAGRRKVPSLHGPELAKTLSATDSPTARGGTAGMTSIAEALSLLEYGSGRVAILGCDPEQRPTQGTAEIVVRAMDHASMTVMLGVVPGMPVSIDLESSLLSGSDATALTLESAPDAGLAVVQAPLAATLAPPTWSFSLSVGESAIRSLVVAPEAGDARRVEARLLSSGAGLATASIAIGPVPSREALLASVVSLFQGMSATAGDEDLRIRVLADLHQLDLDPASAEASIRRLLDAIDALLAMGAPPSGGREQLDALLRSVEIASTLLY